MYHIAIVEDEKEFRDQLRNYLKYYESEFHIEFQISEFEDGEDILRDYKNEYDIILLDIEMPRLNGMDAAELIREKDEEVVLMFITNMAQYAIRGYSVGALDLCVHTIAKWMPNDRKKKIGSRQTISALMLFAIIEMLSYAPALRNIDEYNMDWKFLYLSQMMCIVILYLQNELFKKSDMKQELELMNLLWTMKASYQGYEKSQQRRS